jgi:hypothetical protein
VNIAFVLSREQDSVPLWELIAPVRTTGDWVDFWLPGSVPESWFSDLTPDLPLLTVLENSPVSVLRAVTLSARMAASKWEAEKPSLPDGPAPNEGTDPRPGVGADLRPGEGTDPRSSGGTGPRPGGGIDPRPSEETGPGPGGGTGPDPGMGTDSRSSEGTGPDSAGGTGSGPGGGTGPDSGEGTDPRPGGGADPGSGGGTDPRHSGGTDPRPGRGTDPGPGEGTDPGTSEETGPGPGEGTDPRAQRGDRPRSDFPFQPGGTAEELPVPPRRGGTGPVCRRDTDGIPATLETREREGTVNIAFAFLRVQGSVPLWELIALVRTTGDRVEFWFPGPVPESRFSDLPLLAVLGNSPASALRAVTLSARMSASKWETEKPPLSGGPAPSVGTGPGAASRFSREERRKTCRFLPAGDELVRSVAGIQMEYLQCWEGRER